LTAAQPKAKTASKTKVSASPAATAKKTVATAPKKKVPAKRRRPVYSPWNVPTFAESAAGDDIGGEDLTVRQAAVEALGRYNGSVVAVDPLTGRILTMVNQKTALQSGFQPCSTVKLPVAMAGLIEGLIERDTPLRVQGTTRMTLTEALAKSNNPFFAMLGTKLGFARFSYYARLLGLGEKAGLDIDGEQLGAFPATPPPGTPVGLMTSFGEGIALTPLQLAAMLSAFSNGGTLYYLQYPRSLEEIRSFAPRVKRRLAIGQWVPEMRPGMAGAVEYGTARRANYNTTEPLFGKTGTCTDNRTHLGWFGSYNLVGRNRLVVVVLLTGGSGVSGPAAAQIAGNMYKRLSQESFFADARELASTSLASIQSCCVQ
jgi:cell division protein FtsI/penicillin-binding protein 2